MRAPAAPRDRIRTSPMRRIARAVKMPAAVMRRVMTMIAVAEDAAQSRAENTCMNAGVLCFFYAGVSCGKIAKKGIDKVGTDDTI